MSADKMRSGTLQVWGRVFQEEGTEGASLRKEHVWYV